MIDADLKVSLSCINYRTEATSETEGEKVVSINDVKVAAPGEPSTRWSTSLERSHWTDRNGDRYGFKMSVFCSVECAQEEGNIRAAESAARGLVMEAAAEAVEMEMIMLEELAEASK